MIPKIGTLMVGFVFLTIHPVSAQEGLILTPGRMSYSDGAIRLNISVKNGTSNLVGTTRVECGFFSKGELIATGHTYVENIAPNATGYKTVIEFCDTSPDRAECRIVSVK